MKSFVFDPRILISPPYIECPKCGAKEFGVLAIRKNYFLRRCKNCMYPKGDDPEYMCYLPPINKKVIYLDQFAISEMMKLLNPRTNANKANKIDPFWKILFEKIERLSKLQLILCPDSDFHENESLVTPFFKELKRIYELFSYGVTFTNSLDIQVSQFINHAEKWIKGEDFTNAHLNVSDVISDEKDIWQDRLILTLDTNYNEDWIDGIIQDREATHDVMINLFQEWAEIRDFNFLSCYEKESKYYGKTILQNYLSYIKALQEKDENYYNLILNKLLAAIIFYQLEGIFMKNNVDEKDLLYKITEYLQSDIFNSIPFVHIYSLMIAALVRKAQSGQKKAPNRGMINDISIISYLMPYCDVIFIDNGCDSLLSENPIPEMIKRYGTKIFSLNKKEQFLEYLDNIEATMPESHMKYVTSAYGEDWLKPYLSIFKNE